MYVPTSDIGSHENTAGFALKLVEGAQSRWLGHLAVQRNGTEAEVAQKQRYSHGAIARGCEDDDRVAGVLVEQVHEVAVLVLGRNEDVVLRQRLHGRVSDPRKRNRASVGRKGGGRHQHHRHCHSHVLGVDLDLDRVGQRGSLQLLDLGSHGGREQERVALLGRQRHDLVNVLFELGVEQAISLIQDLDRSNKPPPQQENESVVVRLQSTGVIDMRE